MGEIEKLWRNAGLYRELSEVFEETKTLLKGKRIELTCDYMKLAEAKKSAKIRTEREKT